MVTKLPSIVLVVLASSIVAFMLPRMAPGDPAQTIAGPDATPDQVAAVRTSLGLDASLPEQYLTWLAGVFRGDLGTSYIFNRPVSELIFSRMESTLELALFASLILILLGLGLGVLGGSVQSRLSRFAVDTTSTLLLATPAFLIGLLLIVLLGVTWRVLPVSGEVALSDNFEIGIQYLLLPALALGLSQAPSISRLLQTTMLANRSEDFVDLARAKGASERRLTYRHVLRTSMGASVVAIGMRIGDMFGGAIIIEAIFARNGLGQLAVQAVNARDYQLIQVLIMWAVLIAVISQMLTDIALAALDPRVRLDS